MAHYLVELALWMLVTFLVGCLLGAILRKFMSNTKRVPVQPAIEEPAAAATAARLVAEKEPLPGHAPMAPRWTMAEDEAAASPAAAPPVETLAAAGAATTGSRMPVGIPGPRNSRPDELQRISGVGPKNEQVLHSLGFYHFDQIAQWTEQHVEWVDGYLRFNGRIRRENWVDQARLLAAGEEEEFLRLYGTGGMAGASGQTLSGERTRQS